METTLGIQNILNTMVPHGSLCFILSDFLQKFTVELYIVNERVLKDIITEKYINDIKFYNNEDSNTINPLTAALSRDDVEVIKACRFDVGEQKNIDFKDGPIYNKKQLENVEATKVTQFFLILINFVSKVSFPLCKISSTKKDDIQVVAVNDLVTSDNLAYLLKSDSTHGPFLGTASHEENSTWKRLRELIVDYVVESTGIFTSKELAEKHLKAGTKRVIITAPIKGDITTFVMGVNEKDSSPERDYIVSNASCTINCLAPICKVLLDSFEIEEGLMTTVYALKNLQI
ncbi:hypothetical protein ACTFIW_003343 [Dictyostelium discoideum]